MRAPTAVDALARWLILATAGLGLLLVLPGDLFGPDPVLAVAGQPVTVANLVGLTVMFVAWVAFLVRLFTLGGECRADGTCRILLVGFVLTASGALLASAVGSVAVLVALTVPAVLAQVALAFRADLVNARRTIRRRRRLVGPGS